MLLFYVCMYILTSSSIIEISSLHCAYRKSLCNHSFFDRVWYSRISVSVYNIHNITNRKSEGYQELHYQEDRELVTRQSVNKTSRVTTNHSQTPYTITSPTNPCLPPPIVLIALRCSFHPPHSNARIERESLFSYSTGQGSHFWPACETGSCSWADPLRGYWKVAPYKHISAVSLSQKNQMTRTYHVQS